MIIPSYRTGAIARNWGLLGLGILLSPFFFFQKPCPDRFDDSARRALALAFQSAREFRHPCVGTVHILMGLARCGGFGQHLVESHGLDASRIQSWGKPGSVMVMQPPFTQKAKSSLDKAMEFGASLGHEKIGGEHLLFGLLASFGDAHQILMTAGLRLDEIRAAITDHHRS